MIDIKKRIAEPDVYPNENYLQRQTSLCNSFQIWVQIFNFCDQVSAPNESWYLCC